MRRVSIHLQRFVLEAATVVAAAGGGGGGGAHLFRSVVRCIQVDICIRICSPGRDNLREHMD